MLPKRSFNAGITRTAADFIQGKVAGLTITTSTGDVTAKSIHEVKRYFVINWKQ